MIVINDNGMTKNYQGVYRSEFKENPIVVLTTDIGFKLFSGCLHVQFLICYNKVV